MKRRILSGCDSAVGTIFAIPFTHSCFARPSLASTLIGNPLHQETAVVRNTLIRFIDLPRGAERGIPAPGGADTKESS